jgi:hypothetical protein
MKRRTKIIVRVYAALVTVFAVAQVVLAGHNQYDLGQIMIALVASGVAAILWRSSTSARLGRAPQVAAWCQIGLGILAAPFVLVALLTEPAAWVSVAIWFGVPAAVIWTIRKEARGTEQNAAHVFQKPRAVSENGER